MGYRFSDKALLGRSLTRKAFALEQAQRGNNVDDQEVLRTLGDAVLRLSIVDILIAAGCSTRGDITIQKSKMENERTLAQIARTMDIGPHILLGAGEQIQGANNNPHVLAETLEAVLGAVYVDGGFDAAKDVIACIMHDFL